MWVSTGKPKASSIPCTDSTTDLYPHSYKYCGDFEKGTPVTWAFISLVPGLQVWATTLHFLNMLLNAFHIPRKIREIVKDQVIELKCEIKTVDKHRKFSCPGAVASSGSQRLWELILLDKDHRVMGT